VTQLLPGTGTSTTLTCTAGGAALTLAVGEYDPSYLNKESEE
jgi:hypothetical protein